MHILDTSWGNNRVIATKSKYQRINQTIREVQYAQYLSLKNCEVGALHPGAGTKMLAPKNRMSSSKES
jgi:hypothetical protein